MFADRFLPLHVVLAPEEERGQPFRGGGENDGKRSGRGGIAAVAGIDNLMVIYHSPAFVVGINQTGAEVGRRGDMDNQGVAFVETAFGEPDAEVFSLVQFMFGGGNVALHSAADGATDCSRFGSTQNLTAGVGIGTLENDGRSDGVGVTGKLGYQESVLCEIDSARIGGVAILPLHKVIAIGRHSFHRAVCQVIVSPQTRDGISASACYIAFDGEFIRCEQRCQVAVTLNLQYARIDYGTIRPLYEVIAIVWNGLYRSLCQIVE